MSSSPARIAANRENSLQSTGPRTDDGEAIARANALKHDLTGAGIVIPGEDHREVADRVEAFRAELAPGGEIVARSLATRAAMLMVRSERCIRHEIAVTADRVRNAEAAFDEERRARADRIMTYIAAEPATNRRLLISMPEGVDILLATLAKLRVQATPGPNFHWSMHHSYRLDVFTGNDPGLPPETRCSTLSRALDKNDYSRLEAEVAHLAPHERTEWVGHELVTLIDAEITYLQAHRETLDFDAIAQSRAEAGQRALIGTDPATLLARKYESATERALLRTFQELRTLQKDRDRAAQPATPRPPADIENLPEMLELDRPLASFFPLAAPPDGPAHASTTTDLTPTNRPFADGRPGKNRPKLRS